MGAEIQRLHKIISDLQRKNQEVMQKNERIFNEITNNIRPITNLPSSNFDPKGSFLSQNYDNLNY